MKSFLSLDTDTYSTTSSKISETEYKQKGGSNDYKKKAPGSFPPIYKVSLEQFKDKDDDNKPRQFSKKEQPVLSIKDIMQERRDENKPFISL